MSDADFESFADDLDDIIPDNVPDDTYKCELVKCENVKGKDNRRWLILNWEIIEEGPYFGEEIGPEVYQVFSKEEFEKADPEEQKKLKKVRRRRLTRLESLGVPKDKLSEFKPEDLKGLNAHLTIRVRPKQDGAGDNFWIDSVVLASAVSDTLSVDSF